MLSSFQLRLVCHDVCVIRMLRTKRRDSPSGRVQTGGHDDPTFVTNAKKTHGAFRHRRRRRGRSLIPTPNYATHTTLRARESTGAFLMVLSANINHMKRVPWVAFSSRWYGVVGLAHRSREVDRKAKTRAGRSTQEETRRGRASAMHAVAAARTFWLCGTEKCPSDFATEGVCGGS